MSTNVFDERQLDSWELMLLHSAHDISIPPSQYQTIEQRYQTLREILSGGFEPLLVNAHVFPQGSIRLKTAIKPTPEAVGSMATVDADAIVWLPNATSAKSDEVLAAIRRRFETGVRVDAPIEDLRRGIRIVYADENPGFHIDVTPARNLSTNPDAYGIGHLQVPDREVGWKASSPIAYSDWLEQVAELNITFTGLEQLQKRDIVFDAASQEDMPAYEDYVDGNALRAVVKLLKRHRDKWAIETGNEETRPISAIITTLAARAYEKIVVESKVHKRRPVAAMIEIVDRMAEFIESGSQGIRIINPKDEHENFGEKWNRPNGEGMRYQLAFNQWHVQARNDIRMGLHDFGSNTAFNEEMSRRFGVSKGMLTGLVADMPSNWPLPGRKGVTHNDETLKALAGFSVAGSTTQNKIQPVGRLG